MKWKFNVHYFLPACLLFATEVVIALFVRDGFVRPYAGDFLVVILLYCLIKSFLTLTVWKTAIIVLLLSFVIESLQYIRFIDIIGLSGNKVLKTVLGYGFEWWDILAYTLGILAVLLFEKVVRKA